MWHTWKCLNQCWLCLLKVTLIMWGQSQDEGEVPELVSSLLLCIPLPSISRCGDPQGASLWRTKAIASLVVKMCLIAFRPQDFDFQDPGLDNLCKPLFSWSSIHLLVVFLEEENGERKTTIDLHGSICFFIQYYASLHLLLYYPLPWNLSTKLSSHSEPRLLWTPVAFHMRVWMQRDGATLLFKCVHTLSPIVLDRISHR